MAQPQSQLWFQKTDSGIGVRPACFAGKMATIVWVVLCLFAFIYSSLELTLFVIAFYTAVFLFLVFVKSDLRPDAPTAPPQDPNEPDDRR